MAGEGSRVHDESGRTNDALPSSGVPDTGSMAGNAVVDIVEVGC